jgi:hypothetical protein
LARFADRQFAGESARWPGHATKPKL